MPEEPPQHFRPDKFGPSQGLGILIACCVILAWAVILYINLFVVTSSNWQFWPLLILIQTWLYTGLFITAHDAMHGTLAPRSPKLNHFIGSIAVYLFAGFDYKLLHDCHHKHHDHPATELDPDYFRNQKSDFKSWFVGFMARYTRISQLLTMTVLFQILYFGFNRDLTQLILLWNVPALLSAVQLFYFGTYIPHKKPTGGYTNRHRASTDSARQWLAILKCFNFGYHFEHHEYPFIPWWRLGSATASLREINPRNAHSE